MSYRNTPLDSWQPVVFRRHARSDAVVADSWSVDLDESCEDTGLSWNGT